jgi:hypothetical protein
MLPGYVPDVKTQYEILLGDDREEMFLEEKFEK